MNEVTVFMIIAFLFSDCCGAKYRIIPPRDENSSIDANPEQSRLIIRNRTQVSLAE